MEFRSTMASNDINAISPERDALVRPAVSATRPDVPAQQTHVETRGEGGDDAVHVSVSSNTASQSLASGQVASERASDTGKTSDELKKALSNIRGTTVQFDAAAKTGGAGSLSFKVIDTDTGEVVQEFPIRVSHSAHGVDLEKAKGLLLEDSI